MFPQVTAILCRLAAYMSQWRWNSNCESMGGIQTMYTHCQNSYGWTCMHAYTRYLLSHHLTDERKSIHGWTGWRNWGKWIRLTSQSVSHWWQIDRHASSSSLPSSAAAMNGSSIVQWNNTVSGSILNECSRQFASAWLNLASPPACEPCNILRPTI